MAKKYISIANYLADQGKDYSYAARKQLAKLYNIEGYHGTAEQNLKLLGMLQKGVAPTAPVKQRVPTPTGNIGRKTPEPVAIDNTRTQPRRLMQPVATPQPATQRRSVGQTDPRKLRSGVIIDKGQNVSYIIQNGKKVSSAPVLTGQNSKGSPTPGRPIAPIEQRRAMFKERTTPTGTYLMKPSHIYGKSGMRMLPIPAFGSPAPYVQQGNTFLAQHVTPPNKQDRNVLYDMPADKRYASMGCTNYRDCDMKQLTDTFQNPDTVIVADSRTPKDAQFLQQFNNEVTLPQYGLGSWLKENAGGIGTALGTVGGLAATALIPGVGAALAPSIIAAGSSIGGAIGGNIQQNNATNVAQTEQQNQLDTQAALANYYSTSANNPIYTTSFKNGGTMAPTSSVGGRVFGWTKKDNKEVFDHVQYRDKNNRVRYKSFSTADGKKVSPSNVKWIQKADSIRAVNDSIQQSIPLKAMGGVINSLNRVGVPYREDGATTPEFPYDGTSMYKGGYQLDKAKEIYTPDETGHLPSVDYRTGVWLKDKDYPTAWKELMQTQLNTSLSKELGHPILNINGRLQYPKGYAQGGMINSLACGGKLKAMGGKLESSDKIDGISIYKNGGTHEQSPLGGIPIGNKGRVEEGEVRFGNYIFSNRF